jgi:hypothetical protein
MGRAAETGGGRAPEDRTAAAASATKGALSQLDTGPIFIVGQFRSGTTWIYDMLTAHPLVAGAFESWMFTYDWGLAPLGNPGHFMSDTELFGRHYRLGQLITRERLIGDLRRLTSEWLGEALEPEHRFLVEKTPSHFTSMPFIVELHPGARFVHVLRDGRDVAVSALAAAASWGKGYIGTSVRAQGEQWAQAVRTTRRHGETLEAPFLELRYEDVKAAPREQLARLFDFCSIPYDGPLLDRIVEQADFARHAKQGQSAFRRHGATGEWRQTLGFRQCLDFERGSGGMLAETGYEASRWWFLRMLAPRPRRR